MREVNLIRTQVLRPHLSSVIHLAIETTKETIFVSISSDQTLFIYNFSQEGCDSQLEPLAFISMDTKAHLITFIKDEDDAVAKPILYFSIVLLFTFLKLLKCSLQDSSEIIAAEENFLMKITFPKEIEPAEDTYFLKSSKIETYQLDLDNNIQISQFELINKNLLWILSSNGNLYEHNTATKQLLCIEDSQQIHSFILL